MIASVLASAPAISSRSKNANATHSSSSSSTAPSHGGDYLRIQISHHPEGKFVVSVTVVVYLIFPTLCKQTFKMFDCKTTGTRTWQWTSAPATKVLRSYNHTGFPALRVAGFPYLLFSYAETQRGDSTGEESAYVTACSLERTKTRLTFGLYLRPVKLAWLRLVCSSIGDSRKLSWLFKLILFICITVEISYKPYKLVTKRHKILGQLELV